MNQITCPKCGTVINLDESDYEGIVRQVRDDQFAHEVEERVTLAMRIEPVHCDRELFRDLLLLADEQWDMVELYLHRGEMFAAFAEDGPRTKAGSALVPDRAIGCMIVTDEGVDERGLRIAEVKSLAVDPAHQRSGIGRALLEFAAQHTTREYDILRVGTGDSPLTVPFYEACGFTRSHVLPNFFIENYDHPIVEAGVQLKDMVILEKRL